jgi:hydroxyacyl-ACP dehydratase HTD2-like protein with hotdog domain
MTPPSSASWAHASASRRENPQNGPQKGDFTSAREEVFYEDVDSGDQIPALTVVVDETQMFFFSAATYNGHRIHYDKDWARDTEGYDNVLVQGPLQAALLSRALTDWIGGAGRLVAFSVQNRAIAYPGQQLTFGGVITGKREGGLVDLDIFCKRGDEVLMPGTATVALPSKVGP